MFLPVASWSQTETMEELLSEHDSLFIVNFELNEELGYLAEQVELLKVSYETQKNTLQSLVELKKENEKLREIMRDYINQISELNTININLESDKIYLQEKLDKCAETK